MACPKQSGWHVISSGGRGGRARAKGWLTHAFLWFGLGLGCGASRGTGLEISGFGTHCTVVTVEGLGLGFEVRGQGSGSVEPISKRVTSLTGSGCGPGAQKLDSANRRDIVEGHNQGKNKE